MRVLFERAMAQKYFERAFAEGGHGSPAEMDNEIIQLLK